MSRPEANAVLLTGATGFVGMELLARFVERSDRDVLALVRADSQVHADERMRETLAAVFGDAERHRARVTALAGDLTRPGLGLADDAAALVAERAGEIVHGAASIAFDLGLDEARAVNVEGTRRVLALAERCRGLRRLTYISTAYVAGTHRGRFTEDDLDVGQCFRNTYEQTKFEAEGLVRSRADRLAITIVRPSIVVGDSATGWTASFNVLYWPMRALQRGAYPLLPALRDAPVDVVSVDYVADAIVALTQAPDAAGRTYHLTAADDATTIGELLALTCDSLDCPKPPIIPPRLFTALRPLVWVLHPRSRRLLRASADYLPYFVVRTRLDDTHARAALAPAIAPAPLPEYFDRIVDYAQLARWGMRPLTRAQAAARARPARGDGEPAARPLIAAP